MVLLQINVPPILGLVCEKGSTKDEERFLTNIGSLSTWRKLGGFE